jgi:hypothetical protein
MFCFFPIGNERYSSTLAIFKLKVTSVFKIVKGWKFQPRQDGVKAGGGGKALLAHHTGIGQNPARRIYMHAPLQAITPLR